MAVLRKQTVKDRDGNILYEGDAGSLKEFVEMLVQNGRSLARVDLRRRDLSGLDLHGVDFQEALLDGADLRGMSAYRGKFANASLRGVVAQGLLAEGADFTGVDVSPDPEVSARHYDQRGEESIPSHFEGARLTYAKFSGAVLDGAFFDHAAMSRSDLSGVKAAGASFKKARMHDVTFGFSLLVGSSFNEAKLTTTTGVDAAHLPDRTAWTTVANCSFDGAELDGTVRAFTRDHLWSRALRVLAYSVSSGAIFAGAHHLHIGEETSALGDLLASGTTLVMATTAAVVLKDMLAERARDFVEHHLSGVDHKVRSFFEKAMKAGANLRHLLVATVKGPGLKAMVGALRQTRGVAASRGFFSDFWAGQGQGSTSVIFADRRHLAVALEALCAGEARHRLQGDLVLIAPPGAPAEASIVRYRVDGSTSMAWVSKNGSVRSADYDRDGELLRLDDGAPAEARITGHIRSFETALIAAHALKLDYDRTTHHIRAGQDGSILVMNRANRRLGNPLGPSLIKPDGSLGVSDARATDERQPPADAPMAGGAAMRP
ncbi:uncharacterized protein YjbI with pentapeptide repeats [Bradyrhizobium sp. USDA 4341]